MSACNKNCNCESQKCTQYTDCSGNTFCICQECQEPYIQEQEILAPVFQAIAVGTDRFYRAYIEQNVYKKKGKAYLHIKRPFRVNDIFVILKEQCVEYFISKKFGRKDNFNNFVYQIKRVDGQPLTFIDLNKLTKGKELIVKGNYVEKNQ